MADAASLNLVLALGAAGTAGWLLGLRMGRQHPRGRHRRPRPGEPWPLPAQQLRQWLEAMPQGWLVLAPDGSLSALNPRAEALLNLQRDLAMPGLALLGQPLATLAPGDDVLHLVALARDKGQAQRGRWQRPGGTLELRVLPGGDGWVAVVLEGINPLQQQLQRQEAWVGDVAHELRTPITALMLVGDSLAARLMDQPQARLLVERLQKELRRLQELVSDLLALSRLENTPLEEAKRQNQVDPRDVLGSVWTVLEPLAQQRGVGLRVSPGRDQAHTAAVDPARLHQALLNLLDNALRYSPDASTIEVNLEQRDRWCLIGVRDHGPGLSSSDLERMFERFYRGDPSRARTERVGSGLGLPIVQQIALSQGGMVRARNHPEGGAQLELLLPRA
jgi:two-component system, OmpR family, phosphate regulon sensor histidine kinase PhoR